MGDFFSVDEPGAAVGGIADIYGIERKLFDAEVSGMHIELCHGASEFGKFNVYGSGAGHGDLKIGGVGEFEVFQWTHHKGVVHQLAFDILVGGRSAPIMVTGVGIGPKCIISCSAVKSVFQSRVSAGSDGKVECDGAVASERCAEGADVDPGFFNQGIAERVYAVLANRIVDVHFHVRTHSKVEFKDAVATRVGASGACVDATGIVIVAIPEERFAD